MSRNIRNSTLGLGPENKRRKTGKMPASRQWKRAFWQFFRGRSGAALGDLGLDGIDEGVQLHGSGLGSVAAAHTDDLFLGLFGADDQHIGGRRKSPGICSAALSGGRW